MDAKTEALEALRLKAKGICQGILSGSIDALTGARELSDLRHRPEGKKVIPLDFVGLDSETDGLPTPDRYYLWDPNALSERLPAIERCRSEIRYAAREFLREGQRP